jgi:lambda family phage portal protein
MAILVGAIVDNPPPRRGSARLQPRLPRGLQLYDAAVTNDNNRKHWVNADNFSALWANRADVRRKLRDRSRYEQANNGYFRGAIRTAANDIVGRRGPKYRFAFEDAPDLNSWLDWEFAKWMKAIGFRRKLKTMVRAKKGDGEAVAILTSNPALTTPVKLDLRLVEADQLTTPTSFYGVGGDFRDINAELSLAVTDGIVFDQHGNPKEYHILREHPGGGFNIDPWVFDRFPAASVIHWFDVDRPGQARGVPDTTSSLSLGAMLRRFSLASLQAAEIQADFAGVLETDGATNPDDPPVEIPGIEIERGMIPTLPDKYKLHAFDPTHPTATYPQFKREVLSEIGRGIGQPYNVIAADSSSHNYSSARLDMQEYQDDVNDERNDVEEVVLERIKDAWLAEALAIPDYVPFEVPEPALGMGDWYWSGWKYIDPTKEITAIQIGLENNLTTLKAEHAKNGDDWREVLTQRAEEIALCNELGIPLKSATPLPAPTDITHPANQPNMPETPPRRGQEAFAWNR